MSVDNYYNFVKDALLQGEPFSANTETEDRPLTVREWVNVKVLRKSDPRVHYLPIRIALFDEATE